MDARNYEIVIDALVEHIRRVESMIPGASGDPLKVIDKLVARGEVEFFPCEGDPLAQRTFRVLMPPYKRGVDV